MVGEVKTNDIMDDGVASATDIIVVVVVAADLEVASMTANLGEAAGVGLK